MKSIILPTSYFPPIHYIKQLENKYKLSHKDIKSFYVLEHDHKVIGTVALYQYEEMIEIACFAIHGNYQNIGYGKKLLRFCEQKAIDKNIKNLFILTTQSEHWFIENNFFLTDRKFIPDERKKTYTIKRNSKYFIKRL